MNSIVVNGVTYTSDADIDIGDLPSIVESIWAEYVDRHEPEKRSLPEAIEHVHSGACWLGEQENYGDAYGHAHVDEYAFCLDPSIFDARLVRGLSHVVPHEMAHVIFGFGHLDERWVKALRLVGLDAEADVHEARRQAFIDGRIPAFCREGHDLHNLEPDPSAAPYGYFCHACSEEYDELREDDADVVEVVEERRRVATSLRSSALLLYNWWSTLLPHPAARTLAFRGAGRTVVVTYARVSNSWTAASEGPSGTHFWGGVDGRSAVTGLLGNMEDADELLASLKGMELEP